MVLLGSRDYPPLFLLLAAGLIVVAGSLVYETETVQMYLSGIGEETFSVEQADGSFADLTQKPNSNFYSYDEKDNRYLLIKSDVGKENASTITLTLGDGEEEGPKDEGNDELVDPPVLTIVDVQEKSVWEDVDGVALPDRIKLSGRTLVAQGSSDLEVGAITLDSLTKAEDGFNKAFQTAKQDYFGKYVTDSETLWGGRDTFKWVDDDYTAYLTKVSTGKYKAWFVEPKSGTGIIPSNKDDLRDIVAAESIEGQPAREEEKTANQQVTGDTGADKFGADQGEGSSPGTGADKFG